VHAPILKDGFVFLGCYITSGLISANDSFPLGF